jgi:putative ATPase
MLESGEDPLYIVRRLMRFASEDIGLADPQALAQAVAVQQRCTLWACPRRTTPWRNGGVSGHRAKSNALYTAYGKAAEDARRTGHLGVPLHIRNAPTRLMKELTTARTTPTITTSSIIIITRNTSPTA